MGARDVRAGGGRRRTKAHERAARLVNRGVEEAAKRQFSSACALFRDAVAAAPDYALAHDNLAKAYLVLGQADSALPHMAAALARDSALEDTAHTLARLLAAHRLAYSRDAVKATAVCLDLPDIEHQRLVPAATDLVKESPVVGRCLAHARSHDWDAAAGRFLDDGARVVGGTLLARILSQCVLEDAELERLLTAARRAMMMAAQTARKPPPLWSRLAALLATQGWNNEYAWYVDADETSVLDEMARPLVEGPDAAKRDWSLLRWAMYRPLAAWPGWASARPRLSGALAELAVATVAEQEVEAELGTGIVALGEVRDPVSRAVRAQYEENPYPRWRSLEVYPPGSLLDQVRRFDRGDRDPARLAGAIDVLIAGCGTGQHALASALGFGPTARVLATDLSRASLARAARGARDYGVDNIELRQADILEHARLGRRFDVIECVGVLHHMAAPLEGWRVLAGSLKLDGMMMVGLYSEAARRGVAAARRAIAARGLVADAAGIRALRREMLEAPPGEAVRASPDFYALSPCRDLLLHAKEHRFTIPAIATALDALGLEFRGFELDDAGTEPAYRQSFPDDPDMRDLANWAAFEDDHPSIFRNMYQFWCTPRRR